MRKILISGIVILVGVAFAMPFYIGLQAKERFEQAHEQMQQEMFYPQLSVAAGEYQSGWLTSEASTVFTFTPKGKDATPMVFRVVHHVHNTPSLSEQALLSVDSELVLPEAMAKKLEPYFHGQPLLRSHTVVKLNGNETSTFSSPGYSGPLQGEEGGTLEWKGLNATTTSDSDIRHLSITLDMPRFSLKSQEGTIHLAKLHYTSQLRRGAHDLWFGHDEVTLGNLQFKTNTPRHGPADMQVNDLSLAGNQDENGPLVNVHGRFNFGSANLNGLVLRNGVYDIAYNNLDAAALAGLSSRIKELVRQHPDDPQQLIQGVKPHLMSLLGKHAELVISELKVDTPLGNTNGKLKLALTDKVTNEVLENPRGLMDIMNVDIEASIPKPIIIGMISSSTNNAVRGAAQAQKKSISEEELVQQVNTLTQQQIQELIEKKLMIDSGSNFSTVIHYVPHKLDINGQDATPMLNGLMQQ